MYVRNGVWSAKDYGGLLGPREVLLRVWLVINQSTLFPFHDTGLGIGSPARFWNTVSVSSSLTNTWTSLIVSILCWSAYLVLYSGSSSSIKALPLLHFLQVNWRSEGLVCDRPINTFSFTDTGLGICLARYSSTTSNPALIGVLVWWRIAISFLWSTTVSLLLVLHAWCHPHTVISVSLIDHPWTVFWAMFDVLLICYWFPIYANFLGNSAGSLSVMYCNSDLLIHNIL